jgi:CspA family cold shock protein
MANGTVNWFSESYGHGFISPDEGSEDIFVRQVAGLGVVLAEGARVSFEKREGPKGLEATNVTPVRVRGTMLWFNAAKDLGALRTDDGERMDVPGAAFMPGEKPVGRCAGKAIEFELLGGAVTRLLFVPEPNPRRARMRRRR